MHLLRVSLTSWVDDDQPGFVSGTFVDAEGRSHHIVDKVPIFTRENLTADGPWPQPGHVCCAVRKFWSDSQGRELAEIDTDRYGIVSDAGETRFNVSATELEEVEDY
ncbi:MAG TPA: hypothetical protein PL096_13370 [Micropepsaceae bacterium]|nr:hypothetical protein [Micropepsaceae bacterium]